MLTTACLTICEIGTDRSVKLFDGLQATMPSKSLQFPEMPHFDHVCDTVGLNYITDSSLFASNTVIFSEQIFVFVP